MKKEKIKKRKETNLTKPESIKVSFHVQYTKVTYKRSVFMYNIKHSSSDDSLGFLEKSFYPRRSKESTENVYEKPELSDRIRKIFVSKVVVEFCVVHCLH